MENQQSTPEVSTQTPAAPPPVYEERKSRLPIIFIVALLFFIAIGSAFYLGMIKGQTDVAEKYFVNTSETPVPSITSTVEKEIVVTTTLGVAPSTTSTLKTYESKNGKYTFQYPSTWKPAERTEGCGPVFSPPDTKKVWLTVCGPYTNPDETPQKLAIQAVGSNDKLVVRQDMTVGTHSAIMQHVKRSSDSLDMEVYVADVEASGPTDERMKRPTQLGTLGIYFYIQDLSQESKYKEEFSKILSTFTF